MPGSQACGVAVPGLINLGNTCYLNAPLQILLRSPGFAEELKRAHTSRESASRGGAPSPPADQLLAELALLFDTMTRAPLPNCRPVTPSALLSKLRDRHPIFRSAGQQDAQELLRCLLLSLQEASSRAARSPAPATDRSEEGEEKGARKGEKEGEEEGVEESAGQAAGGGAAGADDAGWVGQLFEGEVEYRTRCLECDSVRCRYEVFSELSLPVHYHSSLHWSLSRYFAEEQFRGANRFYCDECQALTEATRTPRIRSVAPILTVHLKRFQQASASQPIAEARRVTSHVAAPSLLQLHRWATAECAEALKDPLHLYAIVAHSGRSGCGHYTGYVEAPPGLPVPPQSWLCFDDEQCSVLTAEDITTLFAPTSQSPALACLLFYRRKRCDDNIQSEM